MALATSNHVNSILQDVVGKRETELGYHSGYLLRYARQKGVKMPTWRVLHELIKAGAWLEQSRHNEFIPMSKDGEVSDLPEWTYGIAERNWKIERVVERGEVIRPEMFEELEQDPLEGDHEVVEETPVSEEQSTTQEATRPRHEPSPLIRRLKWTSTSDPTPTKRQRTLIPVPHLGFDSKKDRQVKKVIAAVTSTRQSTRNNNDKVGKIIREFEEKSAWKETIQLTTETVTDKSSRLDTELLTKLKDRNFVQGSSTSLEPPAFAKDIPQESSSLEQPVPTEETQNVDPKIRPV